MLDNIYNVTFENKDGNIWCSELKAKSKWVAVNKAKQQLLDCLKDSKVVESFLPIDIRKGEIETVHIEGDVNGNQI